MALKSFIPPDVDPAAPPMIIAKDSINFADSVQSSIFAEENPVQVIAETN